MFWQTIVQFPNLTLQQFHFSLQCPNLRLPFFKQAQHWVLVKQYRELGVPLFQLAQVTEHP